MMGRLPHRSSAFLDSPRDMEWTHQAMLQTDTPSFHRKALPNSAAASANASCWRARWPRNPEVLLLDEPTVYLDLKHQMQFYDILERLNAERHMTNRQRHSRCESRCPICAAYDCHAFRKLCGRWISRRGPHAAALYDIFEITAVVLSGPMAAAATSSPQRDAGSPPPDSLPSWGRARCFVLAVLLIAPWIGTRALHGATSLPV